MNNLILKIGLWKMILLIILFSTLSSIGIDLIIVYIFLDGTYSFDFLLRAAIIPLIITPSISWYTMNLIFELDRLKQEMTRLATYDYLTGLFNRRAFNNSCHSLHEYSVRNKQVYSLLSIDLDFFKKINDKYGHNGGDEVLSSFGKTSRDLSRKSDVLSRFGGEEFVFFLPNTSLEQAKDYAQRLRNRIKEVKVIHEGQMIDYTISIGLAVNRCNDQRSLEDMLKFSDESLFSAKNNGRDQTCIYPN